MSDAAFILGHDRLDSLVPTFFIGLGGSGGRTIDVLAQRLQREPQWHRFKDLIHFVSVDTDQGDLDILEKRGHAVSNISVEAKPDRIRGFRGQSPGIPADDRVTSWVHDWYNFRAASSKGAGQIRLESRFSLYCQLRQGSPRNVRSIIRDRLNIALRARNANAGALREVRFFLYGSLAGGTGSGANISVAYLCRRLARNAGLPDIGIKVYGCFFLPSLFRQMVGTSLVNSINANGYAALKEIEHLMELRYRNAPSQDESIREEFVHDPASNPARQLADVDFVEQPPFDWAYLIDQPQGTTLDPTQIYRAVGEVALLQMFSPILRKQESANDNFEKLQMEPRNGYFAVQYGSIGAAVVEFPRDALVAYLSRLASIDVMERMIIGRGSDAASSKLAKEMASPDFKELSETEQNRRIDGAFCEFVEYQARKEMQGKKKAPGVFSQIVAMQPTDERDLVAELNAALVRWYDDASEELDVEPLDAMSISEENPSIDVFYAALIKDFKRAMGTINSKVAAIENELTDSLFEQLFEEVSPLMQRYFLIQTNQRGARVGELLDDEEDSTEGKPLSWCLLPSLDEDDEGMLQLAAPLPSRADYDPESTDIKRKVAETNRRLQEAATTWGQGRRDRAMNDSRTQAANSFNNDIVNTIRDVVMQLFWREVMRLVRKELGARLNVFRGMAKSGLGAVDRLRAEAERSRSTGATLGALRDSFAGEGDADERQDQTFHLGTEVLCDHRSHVRLWDEVWRLAVRDRFDLRMNQLIDVINRQLLEYAESHGTRAVAGHDVLVEVMDAVDRSLRGRMVDFIGSEATGIDFVGGLELEARIRLATKSDAPHPTAAKVDAVDDGAIQTYIEDKLAYAIRMSQPFARIDTAMIATSGDLMPYEPRLFGMPQGAGIGGQVNGPGRSEVVLSSVLRKTAGFQAVDGWQMRDVMTFYQGVLGLPLYAWADVEQSMFPSYDYEVKRGSNTPLHTDKRYERHGFQGNPGVGLPDLSIAGRQAWEALAEEMRRKEVEQGHRALLVKLMAAGVLREAEHGYTVDIMGNALDVGSTLAGAAAKVVDILRDPPIAKALAESAGSVSAAKIHETTTRISLMMATAKLKSDAQEEAACRALLEAVGTLD